MPAIPKSIAQHMADGTYRADRMGDRIYADPIGDIGEPPADMPAHGMRLWHDVAQSLSQSLGQGDRAVLEGMARWWCILLDELRAVTRAGDDRERQKAVGNAGTATRAFMSMANAIGATPIARQRLRGAAADAPEDDLLALRRETA
jgi:phage terminase small subunit